MSTNPALNQEPVTPVSWYLTTLLGIYLILLVVTLSYSLYKLWPPRPEAINARAQLTAAGVGAPSGQSPQGGAEAGAAGGEAGASSRAPAGDGIDRSASQQVLDEVSLFGGLLQLKHTLEVRLLLIVLLAGALGSYVHATTSFVDYVGNRKLTSSWVWWYLLRPFVGMALALVFYFVVRGGFISPGASGEDMNPFGIAALAGLVGMFSKQATDKLNEVFSTFFKTAEGKGDDKRRDKLTTSPPPGSGSGAAGPTITSVTPDSGPVAGGQTVTITGTNFVEGAAVAFGAAPPHPATVAPGGASLSVLTPPADAAGPVDVVVTSPGGATATRPAGYTYTAGPVAG